MPLFNVKFKSQPPLICQVDDTDLGLRYLELVKKNYLNEAPKFRDRPKYTKEYMLSMAKQAKAALGWEWEFDHYNISVTAMMHKDIEQLVGAPGGFSTIPVELDELIHELHYCLHIIQAPTEHRRDGWLQLEWYNDDGFPLDGTHMFKRDLSFGDLRLQNPYVGHGPLQIYLEEDFSAISQTCKLHDFVKPGINIVVVDRKYDVTNQQIIDAFALHAPEFVAIHGEEKIISYIGCPVVGKVLNLEDLVSVANANLLELEYIEFDE